MPLEDGAYPHSPAQAPRPQSSANMRGTPTRTAITPSTPNSSPAPRFPLGRSPQKTVTFCTNSQVHPTNEEPAEDTLSRASIDSSAIFSIYSMYGSAEGGGGSAPAVPALQRQSIYGGQRRDSQGPSPLSSSSRRQSSSGTNAAAAPGQTSWASSSVLGDDGQTGHVAREQQPNVVPSSQGHPSDIHHHQRQRYREDRTPNLPAASSKTSGDDGDSEPRSSTGITPTAANSFSPPSSYHFASSGVNGNHVPHRSSVSSTPNAPQHSHQQHLADDDDTDDESFALDIELGSTGAGDSNPASPTIPSYRNTAMSFLSSPSKQAKQAKRARVKSTASTASRSELAYFDSGIMPSMPAPMRPPSSNSNDTSRALSAMSGANLGVEDNRSFDSKRSSRMGSSADGVVDFSSNLNYGAPDDGDLRGKNNNRMSMSNWLPDPAFNGPMSIPSNLVAEATITQGLNGGGVETGRPASHSHLSPHQQPAAALSPRESQPPSSFPPGGPSPPPRLLHSLSIASSSQPSLRSASPSVSVYATPLTSVAPNTVAFLGSSNSPGEVGSSENRAAMPVNNGPGYSPQPPSLASSRRGSPTPSLGPPTAPPSSFQHHHQQQQSYSHHSNPGSRRQTPSPAPSRTGSLLTGQGPPSINYPHQPYPQQSSSSPSDPREVYQQHSPHSSLSHQSHHSQQSYGASSVITKDTVVSAISGTTATTSGSGIEPSVPPPMPMYHHQHQHTSQLGTLSNGSAGGSATMPNRSSSSPLGRVSQSSHSLNNHNHGYQHGHHHQPSYASSSSAGHRSLGGMQIPKVDKDLPDMPGDRSASRASAHSNGHPGSRRPSPVPSLNLNGSPHIPNGNARDGGFRQSRLVPAVGVGGSGNGTAGALSPSVSQQSTATASTMGTSATVSSTGATTANSSPDPGNSPAMSNGNRGSTMHSPHASLTPHRSSSSVRNRVGTPMQHHHQHAHHQSQHGSPHHSMHSATGNLGGGGSIKAHSTPSLVPSLGEDLDAFHVRSTYAQLEVSGVKGDGYEEGVERTRAARTRAASNISPSTSGGGADTSGSMEDGVQQQQRTRRTKSQVLADAAVADENEKKRELDPKEIRILQSLDRYGFFTVPSHDRLFLVPSSPLLRPLPFSPSAAATAGPPTSLPASPSPQGGSGNASATPRTLSSLPAVVIPTKEAARIAKWGRMLVPHDRDEGGNVQAWTIRSNKASKLRRRTYKGIPDRWRAAAWEVLMTAYHAAAEEESGGGGGRRASGSGGAGGAEENIGGVKVETTLKHAAGAGAASRGVREVARLERDYRDALDKPSSYDIQIDLDVPRTISGHIMFRTRYGAGQRSLFHVLHSFSLRCQSCGYVQGMGPIAATLLSYMSPSLAYTSLVRLHDAYSLHTVFAPGFPGLLEAIYVQERLTQVAMPAVYAAFQKHMISTTSYATKWYITLFANSVPFQTQLRLWDVFLLEGYDLYIAVAVAIVWVYRDHITSAAANFETVLSMLSGFFVPEDEDVLMGWIERMLGDRRIRSAMRGWRKEWRELVGQGKEGTSLL